LINLLKLLSKLLFCHFLPFNLRRNSAYVVNLLILWQRTASDGSEGGSLNGLFKMCVTMVSARVANKELWI